MKHSVLFIVFSFAIHFHLLNASDIVINDTYLMCETELISNVFSGTIYDSGGEFDVSGTERLCSLAIQVDCEATININVELMDIDLYDNFDIYEFKDGVKTKIYSESQGVKQFEASNQVLLIFKRSPYPVDANFKITWEATDFNINSIVADFNSKDTTLLNFPTLFSDLSSPDAIFWDWDFGDGNKSTVQNPKHPYVAQGDYTVELTTQNCTSTDIISSSIYVQGSPDIEILQDEITIDLECGQDSTILLGIINNSTSNDGFYTLIDDRKVINESLEKELIWDGESLDFSFETGVFKNIDSFSIECFIIGDYDDDFEFVEFYIEGELLDTFAIESSELGEAIYINKTYPFELVEEWVKDGMLEITLDNSSSVGSYEYPFPRNSVSIYIREEKLFNPNYLTEIVATEDSSYLEINVSLDNYLAGVYEDEINLFSNQDGFTSYSIPLTINLDAETNIVFSEDCLDFGTVQQFDTVSYYLQLNNDGCASITIEDIQFSSNTFFVKDPISFIGGYEKDSIQIFFSTEEQAEYDEMITIITNDGELTHCLTSESVYSPIFSIQPQPVNLLLECSQDTTIELLFINDGEGILEFEEINMDGHDQTSRIEHPLNTSEIVHNFDNYPLYTDLNVELKIDRITVSFNEFLDLYIDDVFIRRFENLNLQEHNFFIPINGVQVTEFLKDKNLKIELRKSNNVNFSSNAFTQIKLSSKVFISEEFDVSEGSILPNDTLSSTLTISAEKLRAGIFDFDYSFLSNDPLKRTFSYPIQVEVIGEPASIIPADCIEFDTSFLGISIERSFIIENPSCSDLEITNLSTSSNTLSFDQQAITIRGYDSQIINATFNSDVVETIDDYIVIESNAGLDSICFSAVNLSAPGELIPGSIDLDFMECDESITIPVTLKNQGSTTLQLSLETEPFKKKNITELKDEFLEKMPELALNITNLDPINGGFSGMQLVSDGGYRHGNMLNAGPFIKIPYTGNEVESIEIDNSTLDYFTIRKNGVFLFVGDFQNLDEFYITGSLISDDLEEGIINGKEIQLENTPTISAFYKQVYNKTFVNSIQPSVNHLLLVEGGFDQLNQEFSTNTERDYHKIYPLANSSRIVLLAFTGKDSQVYQENLFKSLSNEIIDILGVTNFLSSSEEEISINANESKSIDVSFSSKQLSAGNYTKNIVFNSDDLFNTAYTIPVSFQVDQSLCNLEIKSEIQSSCNGYVNFSASHLNEANNYLWDFGDGKTSTERTPEHIYTEPGNYSVQLEISNDISSISSTKEITIEDTFGPKPSCWSNGFGSNIGIQHFRLNDINLESTTSKEQYQDFTCTSSTKIAKKNNDFQIRHSSSNAYIIGLWIDFDNNGDFSSEELIAIERASLLSGTFDVPSSAVENEPLRLRIISNVIDEENPDPCEVYFGEIEDHTVIIDDDFKVNLSNNISIFPNPASEGITISNNNIFKIVTVDILDAQGKLARSVPIGFNANQEEIYIPKLELPHGMYFLVIHYEDESRSNSKVIFTP